LRIAGSKDGTRIAYEVAGAGPALILLHGGGQDRQVWRQHGWTERLDDRFLVIAMDIRGNGESDRPRDPAAYSIDALCEDILAVADAEGAARFALCGYSYGGNIGRYLAARSARVDRFVMIGIPFGPPADEEFRGMILQMQKRWKPVIEAYAAGDITCIPEADRGLWESGQVEVMLAWLDALLGWPAVEPADMRCPTLWAVGTCNTAAMRAVRRYQGNLEGTQVSVALVEGLTHTGELENAVEVLPAVLAFMDRT
jgi:pimeloyl-ACP methyl ester carboxylesterase